MKKAIKCTLAACLAAGLLTPLTGCQTQPVSLQRSWDIVEAFDNIRMEVDVSDIQFSPSSDSICQVIWETNDRMELSVGVENNALVIREAAGVDAFSLTTGAENPLKVTVYLPREEFLDLTVKTDTGDIDTTNYFIFRNVHIETDTGEIGCRAKVTGTVSLESDTGKVLLGASTPTSLELSSNTGDITLQSVVATGALEVESDSGQIYLSYVKAPQAQLETNVGPVTLDNVLVDGHLDIDTDVGDVTLRSADAGSLEIETNTGDITGDLLTGKTFRAKSNLGSVSVPDTTGGDCVLTSDIGDISIQITEQE